MEGITHRTVTVNGINMHIAEKGEGPVVLFLHGFPELWYSWRHQIVGIADKGYHAVAPDLRGYGDTDVPTDLQSYTILHLVGDIVSLIDVLGQDQVFVVGHDWGAIVAWHLCLLRPDRVKALVNLSVPFRLWDPERKPTEHYRSTIGDDFYVCRFQIPGVVEAEFAQMSNVQLLKTFYMSGATPHSGIKLPSWLSEDDINYFASKFDKTGYSGAVNYYRALDVSWELLEPAGLTYLVELEPGETEVEFVKYGCKSVLRRFLTHTYSGPGTVPGEERFGDDHVKKETPLPSWLTEEDINYHEDKFEITGFTGPLSYYRSLDKNWELMAVAPWHGAQIKVPTKFIVGDEDLVYHIPGVKEYIHSDGFKKDVPSFKMLWSWKE